MRRNLTLVRRGVAALAVVVAFSSPLACHSCTDAVASQVAETTTTRYPAPTTTEPPDPPIEITIAAAGDLMFHKLVLRAAYDATAREYDFRPIFAPVAPYLSAADYTVANLETCLAGAQYAHTGYPRFNSPDSVADGLAASGIDLVNTANNHAYDRRWTGVVNTLDCLDEAGLAHVGTHRTKEEKATTSPLVVDIQGIEVAFVGYTSCLNGQYLPNQYRDYGVNFPIDWDQIEADARAARSVGADIVIALLHWGEEYGTEPTAAQVELAEGSADYGGLLALGVDVILGGHSHVVQPAVHICQDYPDRPRDTYVVYSLGNFVSGMHIPLTDSGVIVYVHIRKEGGVTSVTGLSYMGVCMHESGPYPADLRVLPVLPGVEPQTDIPIDDDTRERMDRVWERLDQVFHQPGANIVPLDPATVSGGGSQ